MPYFESAFIDFFEELEVNNHRDWFHANKKRYETYVKNPFKLFVQDLIEGLNDLGEDVQMDAKDAIFRINRDIRFSKDKSPYKTQVSALISAGGKKSMDHPGLYIEFKATEASIYSGAYKIEKEPLYALRSHIAAQPKQFKKLLTDKAFVEKFGEMRGDKNKRIPKEFAEAAEAQPLIFNKSFYYYAKFPAEEILKDNWKETVLEYYAVTRPMGEFLLAGLRK